MALKIFDSKTGTFKNLDITSTSKVADEQNIQYENIIKYDNLEDALNSKLTKTGDTMEGPIVAGDDFKLTNSYRDDETGLYVSSSLIFQDGIPSIIILRGREGEFSVSRSKLILHPDNQPMQDSKGLVTSGVLYDIITSIEERLDNIEARLDALEGNG